ncbi:phage recombination protein Bet [Methanoculleus sp.]|uniref:phage recombination protein Bet n=1 Tax=Methanoculleus sp. TaxID=90427 RepID=UPI0025D8DFC5|nr:phage recombination protein Bet [Methanoculleus sp.]MCK9318915.1 phage recombination protein Bet [Methanoculleus sp.]
MEKKTTQNKVKKTTKKVAPKKKELVVKEQQVTDPALLTQAKIDLIKRTVAKGADNDELQMFLTVSARAGLDPFTKQIHLVKRWSKAEGREIATIQTGIDGYRAIAEKTGKYGGSDDATFTFTKEGGKIPESATVKVFKVMGDRTIEIKATAYWDEFFPSNEKLAFMWKKMPKLMLAKCAEALALRKAFPNVLSGIYTHDELDQGEGEQKDNKKSTLDNSKAYIYSAKSLEQLEDFKGRIEKAKMDEKTRKKLLKYCEEKHEELSMAVDEAEVL